MKKLCAKQNRRAKQWEFSQTVRNVLRISQCEISQCEKPQRISQCEKPFGNAKIHLAMRKSIWQCEKPFGNAKIHLAMRKTIWQCENPFGNFAMRNFAMRKPHCKFRNAKRKFRNAKLLPTVCENSCFAFFFKICSKISKKTTKLMQKKIA